MGTTLKDFLKGIATLANPFSKPINHKSKTDKEALQADREAVAQDFNTATSQQTQETQTAMGQKDLLDELLDEGSAKDPEFINKYEAALARRQQQTQQTPTAQKQK